mmetsp:Transcript_816/g.1646  ORF Transcript_816/g.1646 Transcript_816/m.1646 type:complete len:279 (-) Transcript_816:70-906(-)
MMAEETEPAGETSTTEEDEVAALRPFLAKYGYAAADDGTWERAPCAAGWGEDPGSQLELRVAGHHEADGHTWYEVECSLTAPKLRKLTWQGKRRLVHLREELHDVVKALMKNSYGEYFGAAPFAHKGAPRGTTARLNAWLGALAACINTGGCSPHVVSLTLKFLDVPEPLSLTGSTKAAASSVASRLRERATSVKESAKQRMEQAQIDAARKAQGIAIGVAQQNPKAAQAAAKAGMGLSQSNPELTKKAGATGFSLLAKNPQAAFKVAKLAAKANMSR